jgi:hypothetical protein
VTPRAGPRNVPPIAAVPTAGALVANLVANFVECLTKLSIN